MVNLTLTIESHLAILEGQNSRNLSGTANYAGQEGSGFSAKMFRKRKFHLGQLGMQDRVIRDSEVRLYTVAGMIGNAQFV